MSEKSPLLSQSSGQNYTESSQQHVRDIWNNNKDQSSTPITSSTLGTSANATSNTSPIMNASSDMNANFTGPQEEDDIPDDIYFQEDPLHLYNPKHRSGLRRFLITLLTCCGIVNIIGDNIKSILFGGLDGITTVFVSVATIYSSDVSILTVLIIGIAKLLSGSISMGVGDFMSSKAELDLIRQERKRELWECENFLQGEMDEMIDIYSDKGIERDIADKMVDLMSKNKEAFVDVMMVQELGLKANYDRWGPLKNGITNFLSFIIFGSVPLLVYVIFLIIQIVKGYRGDDNLMFFLDCGITTIALVAMGLLKSRFSTEGWFIAITTTLIVGLVAAGSGYLVALGLDKAIGFKE